MKIGIDLVKISRVAELLENKNALQKIFNDDELSDDVESLAGKLAIKEAYFKARGQKIDWLDLEIKKQESGRPVLFLNNKKQDNLAISISHDGEYAVGVVVLSFPASEAREGNPGLKSINIK